MLTNRLALAVAAGALAVGLLVGSAATVLVSSATRSDWSATMSQMHASMSSGVHGSGMMGGARVEMPGHAGHHGGQP